MLLTATVFAVPTRGGIVGTQANDSSKSLEDSSFVKYADAVPGGIHRITMAAERLDNGLLAYKMEKYTFQAVGSKATENFAGRYSSKATIPGPTIVLTEGDEVHLTIKNKIKDSGPNEMVSVHVHGVHYDRESDGTLMHINGFKDEGATPKDSYTVDWIAGPGTAGTWPYHDHTFRGINGQENKGLFGTVIVNPAGGQVQALIDGQIQTVNIADIQKDYVLYMGDDAFWGTEITPSNGKQKPLWTNPTLMAKKDTLVRFHIIPIGTDLHRAFAINGVEWLDLEQENDKTSSKAIGPLENLAFVIKAKQGTYTYEDSQLSNKLMGMEGKFKVTNSDSPSKASPVPEAI